MSTTPRGKFITLEGNDGAGKSSQAVLLRDYLVNDCGLQVLETREPGGTDEGEHLRDLLLHCKKYQWDAVSETLLMFAARREHLRKKIMPALERGAWVVCDRFTDSTVAYQGGGREVAMELIEALATHVQGGCMPDMTFYLHAPLQPRKPLLGADTFESEKMAFHEAVARQYQELAKQHPQRIVTVHSKTEDGTWYPRDEIHARIRTYLAPLLAS